MKLEAWRVTEGFIASIEARECWWPNKVYQSLDNFIPGLIEWFRTVGVPNIEDNVDNSLRGLSGPEGWSEAELLGAGWRHHKLSYLISLQFAWRHKVQVLTLNMTVPLYERWGFSERLVLLNELIIWHVYQ